jgi:LysR family transcriptional activator of nhaA
LCFDIARGLQLQILWRWVESWSKFFIRILLVLRKTVRNYLRMEFLNYHHLRYFWMVAREGSLRRAAELMNLSQPTISAQISTLEASLGQALFRRSGRTLALTEMGRRVFEVAEEIFSLGQELMDRVHRADEAKFIRVHLGISDALPKLLTWEVIQPIFALKQPVQLTCREGPTAELLMGLVSGRLDMILSDEPAPSNLQIKAYSHHLGTTPTVFCAHPTLAKKLGKSFPASLNDQPMLLPLTSSAWRHSIDAWFRKNQIRPRLVAEFEDAALMKIAAAHGLGVVPVPYRVLASVKEQHQLVEVGPPQDDCAVNYYAITAQRKVTQPALQAMMKR